MHFPLLILDERISVILFLIDIKGLMPFLVILVFFEIKVEVRLFGVLKNS